MNTIGRTLATVDPGALEIEPGVTVGDLKTREECERARFLLETSIDSIVGQITRAEEDARAGKPHDAVWRTRAQGAIRWKRRAIRAVNERMMKLASTRRPVSRMAERRQAVIDAVEAELGRGEIERFVQIAKAKHPELWALTDVAAASDG
jgi:hypothetical protein